MAVALVRIDDRYIHGQIATMWTRALSIGHIYVLNDSVAKDEVTRAVLEMAVPQGVRLTITDVESGTRELVQCSATPGNIMVLFGNPQDVLRAVQGGFKFPKLNVGFMRHSPGKDGIGYQVYVNQVDIDALLAIHEQGVPIEMQRVPTEKSADITGALRSRRHS